MPQHLDRPDGVDEEFHAAHLVDAAVLEAAGRRYQYARNAMARFYGLPPQPRFDDLDPEERGVIIGGLIAVRRLWESTR